MTSIQKVTTLDINGEQTIYLTTNEEVEGNAIFIYNPIISIAHINGVNTTLIGISWELSEDFKILSINGTSINANKKIIVNAYI